MKYDLFVADLTLFEGEGGAEGTTESENATVGYVPRRANKSKGEYDNVVFGKQPEASGDADQSEAESTQKTLSPEERRKAYNDLINGEYKDFYTEDTQKIIDKRFKQTKELEASAKKQQPLLDALATKYGIDSKDLDALTQAVNDDNSMWEEAADKAGMTVEQYKSFQKLQRENAELLEQEASRANEEKAQALLQKWSEEAMELQKTFPSFDLNSEAQNPNFVNLLRSGISVEHAFKVIHMDEIQGELLKTAVVETQKNVANNVRARGSRPTENGASSRSAFVVKNDPSKFTKQDRAEAVRRALQGDIISF